MIRVNGRLSAPTASASSQKLYNRSWTQISGFLRRKLLESAEIRMHFLSRYPITLLSNTNISHSGRIFVLEHIKQRGKENNRAKKEDNSRMEEIVHIPRQFIMSNLHTFNVVKATKYRKINCDELRGQRTNRLTETESGD
jgi:hypothetical protein